MPLKVTWEGNETGASIPLPAAGAVTVTVVVLDETGAPHRIPHEVTAAIAGGSPVDFEALPVSGGTGAQGIVRVDQRWYFRMPRLEVRAARLDGGGAVVRRILVVPGPMLWPVRVAQFLAAIGFLYIIALFPEVLDAVSGLVSRGAGVIAVVVLAAKWLRVRVLGWLTDPRIALPVAAAVLVLSAVLHGMAKLVVNASLEKVATRSGEIAPAESIVALEWKEDDWKNQVAERALCRTDTDRNCETFDFPSTFWFDVVTRFGLVERIDVGCKALPLLMKHKDFWRAQKRCLPTDPPPPVLEHMAPIEAFDAVVSLKDGDHVSIGFGAGADARAFDLRTAANYEILDFGDAGASADSAAEAHEDLNVRMTGSGPVREITATLRSNHVLTPVEGDAGAVLPASLLSSSLVVGDMMVTLRGPSTPCEMATTEQRLAAIVLRKGDVVYRFTAQAPDFVRRFPVCWPTGPRPAYGEIKMDAAWTPVAGWSIRLARREVPDTVAVLDSSGKAFGELDCEASASLDDGPWSIGPVRVEGSSDAFVEAGPELHGPAEWRGAAGHTGDAWIWMCWRETPPSPIFGAHGARAVYDSASHAYRIVRELRDCRYYQDGTVVPPNDRCTDAYGPVFAAGWYAKFDPGDCAPGHKKVCPGPAAADGGAR